MLDRVPRVQSLEETVTSKPLKSMISERKSTINKQEIMTSLSRSETLNSELRIKMIRSTLSEKSLIPQSTRTPR